MVVDPRRDRVARRQSGADLVDHGHQKIDLAGPDNRGLAMGLNEFAGYFAVALSALATGWIASRWGLRPEPFFLGVGFVVLGLLLSVVLVRETRHHVLTSPAW